MTILICFPPGFHHKHASGTERKRGSFVINRQHVTKAPNTSENPIDFVKICHENISVFRNRQELFHGGLTWFTFYVSRPQVLGLKLLAF